MDGPSRPERELRADAPLRRSRWSGKLLDSLDELGLAENTIVIFAADNGTDNVIEARNVRSQFLGQEVPRREVLPDGTRGERAASGSLAGAGPAGERVRGRGGFHGLLADLRRKLPARNCRRATSWTAGVWFRCSWAERMFPRTSSIRGATSNRVRKKYKEPQLHREQWLHVVRDGRWKLYSDGRLFDTESDFLENKPIPPGARLEADAAKIRLKQQLERLRKTEPHAW